MEGGMWSINGPQLRDYYIHAVKTRAAINAIVKFDKYTWWELQPPQKYIRLLKAQGGCPFSSKFIYTDGWTVSHPRFGASQDHSKAVLVLRRVICAGRNGDKCKLLW